MIDISTLDLDEKRTLLLQLQREFGIISPENPPTWHEEILNHRREARLSGFNKSDTWENVKRRLFSEFS